jgi:hypothetical protein
LGVENFRLDHKFRYGSALNPIFPLRSLRSRGSIAVTIQPQGLIEPRFVTVAKRAG